jgi:LysM repeat protein
VIGDYVCVGIIGQTITTTTSSTPTNGISTPTPIQTGMVTNCNSFDLVKDKDTCGAIASTYGISLSTFYAWNPAVGSDCQFLILGDYVCVGTVGFTATPTTSTTTTPTNGISTPTPTQTGMVSNCNKFYLVQSGNTCDSISSANGIPLSLFYTWNPAVGSNCGFLFLNYYVCVGVIGYTPSTTTQTTSTTTSGNGVATPTPFETGMVGNCNKFYYTQSGDTCDSIAKSAGISVQSFEAWNTNVGSDCAYLWLNFYVCIGVF